MGNRALSGAFSLGRFANTEVCRGTESAELRFSPRDAGGVYVRASVKDASPCRRLPSRPFRDVAVPVLFHPPGASSRSGGSGGGGLESQHHGIRLTTTETLSAIAADYVDQMTKSGWPLDCRVTDTEMSVSRHRVTVASGKPITAVLSLVKVPDEPTIDASLRLVRVAPLPR